MDTDVKKPRVSIVLPVHNGEKYIARAIGSVLIQTFVDWELIAVNDGSTDSTEEILKDFAHLDGRIGYFFHEHNKGQGAARRTAISHAQGEYIAFIDDDDEWLAVKKLAIQVTFMDAHPDVVLVGARHAHIVNEWGKTIRDYYNPRDDQKIRKQMLLKNCFTASSVLFRKTAYEAAGGLREVRNFEDYDLWLRMGLKGNMANIDGCDVLYRYRLSSRSSRGRLRLCYNTLKLIIAHRKSYPWFVLAFLKGIARFGYYGIRQLFRK